MSEVVAIAVTHVGDGCTWSRIVDEEFAGNREALTGYMSEESGVVQEDISEILVFDTSLELIYHYHW